MLFRSLIVATATAVFVWLGWQATRPALAMNLGWTAVLGAVLLISLIVGGMALRRTRFS